MLNGLKHAGFEAEIPHVTLSFVLPERIAFGSFLPDDFTLDDLGVVKLRFLIEGKVHVPGKFVIPIMERFYVGGDSGRKLESLNSGLVTVHSGGTG